MLTLLEIENIAVIRKAEAELGPGFNVLTGETGAGKSLLIDSISLVLGGRGQRDLIRAGADYALVRAVFLCPDIGPFLEELGFAPEEDGTVILQRRLYRDGRNVCRLGTAAITLSTLKAIGSRLVAIHGQHDGTALLDSATHVDYIDSYGRCGKALLDYREKFHAWKSAEKALVEARSSAAEREKRIDFLSFQVKEIEDARLKEGEEEELTARQRLLSNAEELTENADLAHQSISAGYDAVSDALSAMETVSGFDPSMEDTAEQLRNIYYELEELRRDISSYASGLEFDPGELSAVDDRIGVIFKLERKYGATEADVLAYLNKAKAELDGLVYADEHGAEMEANVNELKSEAEKAAKRLTDLRKKAADELCRKICAELAFLDMPGTKVTASLTPCPLWEKGGEKAELLISANPSEEPKPLGRIASGGELSRIMLAIKTVFSQVDDLPVMIFDEIDAGVSGRAAAKIGKKLNELAQNHQVICITHLPMIAAAASRHLLIEKNSSGGALTTTVRPIEGEERVNEIARIMCGDSITPAALENARELLGYSKEENHGSDRTSS